jgi:hypothetical protein
VIRAAANWPADPHGYIFLLRACNQLGELKFVDWAGSPWPQYAPMPMKPTLPRKGSDEWEHGRRLLTKYDPETKSRLSDAARAVKATKSIQHEIPGIVMNQQGSKVLINLDPTEADWSRAISLCEPAFQAQDAGWKRRREIQSEIAALCESGKVASVYRPYYGGELFTINRDWWRTEHINSRFSIGRILPRNPFQEATDTQGSAWLFLNRSQFQEHISPVVEEKPAARCDAPSSQADKKAIVKRQWSECDEPHLQAMKKLIKEGKAMNPAEAARRQVAAGGVGGTGTAESKATRLERNYKFWK